MLKSLNNIKYLVLLVAALFIVTEADQIVSALDTMTNNGISEQRTEVRKRRRRRRPRGESITIDFSYLDGEQNLRWLSIQWEWGVEGNNAVLKIKASNRSDDQLIEGQLMIRSKEFEAEPKMVMNRRISLIPGDEVDIEVPVPNVDYEYFLGRLANYYEEEF